MTDKPPACPCPKCGSLDYKPHIYEEWRNWGWFQCAVCRINVPESSCTWLRSQVAVYETALAEIDHKIGHFAGQPVREDLPGLATVIIVADIARTALATTGGTGKHV